LTKLTNSRELLERVQSAERIGLSPHELLGLSRLPNAIEPLTPDEWREAMLATLEDTD
jgi:hypothetical protein